jgi:hypothetical protein
MYIKNEQNSRKFITISTIVKSTYTPPSKKPGFPG